MKTDIKSLHINPRLILTNFKDHRIHLSNNITDNLILTLVLPFPPTIITNTTTVRHHAHAEAVVHLIIGVLTVPTEMHSVQIAN